MQVIFAITNAPEAYDYYYVKTSGEVQDKHGKTWRLVEISDPARFQMFQVRRYGSGLKQAYTVEDKNMLNYLGISLPAAA